MKTRTRTVFIVLLFLYGLASLIHFIHNAEFLSDYPNLPASWSPAGVYLAWLGMTAIGVSGWLLIQKGFLRLGLLIIALYATMGMDSLAHYLVAPFSAHTAAMNATILLEVVAAGLVFIATIRLLTLRVSGKPIYL